MTPSIVPFHWSTMTAVIHLDGLFRDGLLFVLRAIPLFCLVCLSFK